MKLLYTSAAAIALAASGALAQQSETTTTGEATMQPASAKMDGSAHHGLRASDVIGKTIYVTERNIDGMEVDTDAIEWENVGDVNDILLSAEGNVQGVLLDIGGFLGMGERQVMIPASELKFVSGMNDGEEFYIVFPGTASDFEAMEEFQPEGIYSWAADTEAEMEQAAAEVETETEEAAAEIETETEQAAAEIETETEQAAAEVETETEQAAAEVERETEQAEAALEGEETVPPADMAMATGETEGTAGDSEQMQTAQAEEPTQSGAADEPRQDLYAAPAPDVTRDGWERREFADLTTEELTGATVLDANMEDIGTVSELFVDMDGRITEAELSVGGLIWGIGATDVRVSMDSLNIQQNVEAGDIQVFVDLTEEALMDREDAE